MMLVRSADAARATRRAGTLPNGHPFFRWEFLGRRGDASAPQAFLIEQPAGVSVPPHYHETEQFQVVVAGSGTLGRFPVGRVSVNYTGARTGYGPIVAGPAGLSYFTLRPAGDPGARYLPAARAGLDGATRRFRLTGATVEGAAPSETLLEEPDGLAAVLARLGPGAALSPIEATRGGGQFLLVVGGALVHEGATLGPWSCLFVGHGAVTPLAAATSGAVVLALRFPG
jgi:hypothetical protein